MHLITQILQEQERPSLLEEKINQSYISNEGIENEQLEITARLNKIEGLKGLLPSRRYGQKWTDVKFGISAQSLIERCDVTLAGDLKLNSGYWEKIEKTEKSHFKYFDEMEKNIEELLTKKRFSNF